MTNNVIDVCPVCFQNLRLRQFNFTFDKNNIVRNGIVIFSMHTTSKSQDYASQFLIAL